MVRIALWGGPGSGKTTFLYALRQAFDKHEGWSITSKDGAASGLFRDSARIMGSERRFPERTQRPETLRLQVTQSHRHLGRRGRFDVEILDFPGTWYGGADSSTTSESSWSHRDELIDYLQPCDGIVYFFDPLQDSREHDTSRFVESALDGLTQRVHAQAGDPSPRLPHHVAFLITKCDDVEIYRLARSWHLTVQDQEPPHQPRIPGELAKLFFDKLCDYGKGSGGVVRDRWRKHIEPSRLKFFATSSVGFAVTSNEFNRASPENVRRSSDPPILTSVHPLNVVEPLAWLEKSIRRSRAR